MNYFRTIMTETAKSNFSSQRLLSLDFLRGFIMVLLMMGSTSIYDYPDDVFFEIVGGAGSMNIYPPFPMV
jgi:hypothetical protein